MHVEVTEENISIFDLVKFTGNSREDLLKAAYEAKDAGHVLYCQIPDAAERKINVFEHFQSEPSPKQWSHADTASAVVDGEVIKVESVRVKNGEALEIEPKEEES